MTDTLTGKLAQAISIARNQLAQAALPQENLDSAERTLVLTGEEHFEWQRIQSEAHAGGEIATADALTIYAALGETGDPANGGWSPEADLPTKYVVSAFMRVLLEKRLGR